MTIYHKYVNEIDVRGSVITIGFESIQGLSETMASGCPYDLRSLVTTAVMSCACAV